MGGLTTLRVELTACRGKFPDSSDSDAAWDELSKAMVSLARLEKDIAELVKLSTHALSVLRVNKYDIAADHLQEVLNRFEVKK